MAKKKILLAFGLFLLNLFFGRQLIFPAQPYVLFANVGQGDAEIIRTTTGQVILIDGGPSAKVSETLGRRLPFYQRKIDALVLSHAHADHLVGQIDILKRYSVGVVVWNGRGNDTPEFTEWLRIIKEKQIPLKTVRTGDQVLLDAAGKLDILWPAPGNASDDSNFDSLVFGYTFKGKKFLFTGDVSSKVLESFPEIEAAILKVPHHGSKTALSAKSLASIKPEIAVIEVGQNSYGHPSKTSLGLLRRNGIKIFLSQDGDIVF